ncbi:DUF6531 domain-containing protein [Collimonas humicola]|uniref:DUF6531 domain-containing protein n=1 Tax=Collimonas humicola TaxID=2825886 RepID=UPI001B8C9908|nr:DUF6531 domain-containing protein [Collimonas humicola]
MNYYRHQKEQSRSVGLTICAVTLFASIAAHAGFIKDDTAGGTCVPTITAMCAARVGVGGSSTYSAITSSIPASGSSCIESVTNLHDGSVYSWVQPFSSCSAPTLSPKTPGAPPAGSCEAKFGNPLTCHNGNKVQVETDITSEGKFPLLFQRTYNSTPSWSFYRFYPSDYNWSHEYDRSILANVTVQPATAVITRPDGKAFTFLLLNNAWTADADVMDKLVSVKDVNGGLVGWKYTVANDDSTESYDSAGRLLMVTHRNGQSHVLTYSDASTPSNIAPKAGLLIKVTDAFGRQLNLTYDGNSRIQTLTSPAGDVYTYGYNNNLLSSITYPDGKKRSYLYNEPAYTNGSTRSVLLTGIVDENNNRFATWSYDVHGYAISSEHAGGVEKYGVVYTLDSTENIVSAIITNPLGTQQNFDFANLLDRNHLTNLSQPGGQNGGVSNLNKTYDANGNVATRTDFNGAVTTYSYDLTRNLETSRVEASGTSQARTITTAWHATYSLPLQIAEPKLLTTYAYDTSGNLLSKTVQATSDATGAQGLSPTLVGTARTWSYTYNTVGQVLTATGPRTDVADKTIYTYDSSGNLSTITNAVGQVTTLSNYDANGRVGLITDANGATTALTYSPRGWLTGKTVTSGGTVETTTYGYDGVGQLTLVTLPNTSTVSYTYDPAHRLTNIADSLGNSIAYTLDNMGNRISEQVKDPSGALARQTSRVIDALNRIQQITGAVQ